MFPFDDVIMLGTGSPDDRRQVTAWIYADFLPIGPLGQNTTWTIFFKNEFLNCRLQTGGNFAQCVIIISSRQGIIFRVNGLLWGVTGGPPHNGTVMLSLMYYLM